MAGIYIHIPFCRQACYYCDFHFSTTFNLKTRLIKALIDEIRLRLTYLDDARINTIYFGGGTPSVLDVHELAQILEVIYASFEISDNPEITIESNPDDLDQQKTRDLKELGFSRLSIGIQSFDDDTLKFLHRIHSGADGLKAIKYAERAGFENINLDLMFAIRDDHISVLMNDLQKLLEIQPQHISAYSLTIEPDTVFGNWKKKGKLSETSSDESATEYEYVIDTLCQNGYEHYEVSNFSKPGYISMHNSNYWRQVPYIGIGPSAHSYNGRSRQSNISNNAIYIKSMDNNVLPAEIDYLSTADRINEQILTGLRTKWGIDLNMILEKYKIDLAEYNKNYIQDLISLDLATFNNGKLQLKKKGMLIADKICIDLFYIEQKDGRPPNNLLI